MKKFYFIISTMAALVISCNKQMDPEQIPNNNVETSFVKSFKVAMPETRAFLGDNAESGKKLVKFSDGDEITIFSNTSGNCYTGTYNADEEQFEAEITDLADASETVFYAAYPASYVASDNKTYSYDKAWKFKQTNGVFVEAQKVLKTTIGAVRDGIDPALTVLTAKTDEDGVLSFVYGCGFFKIQVTTDDVSSISFTTSSERIGGRPQYDSDCEMVTVQSGVQTITLTADNSLDENGIYYVPFIPRNLDSSGKTQKIGGFSLQFTSTDGKSVTLETSALQNETFVSGVIYNLGAPAISFDPTLTLLKTSVTSIPAAGGSGLTIENAYKLANCTDNDVTVSFDGTVITDASISGGTITYAISQNIGGEREGWIGLNLEDEDPLIITMSQLASGSIEQYSWDFSSEAWQAKFAEMGGLNTDISNWNLTFDGLTIYSAAKSKYRENCFQWGGKGSTSDRYMMFTTQSSGTVSVYASFTGDSVPSSGADRHVSLVDSTNNQQDADPPTATAANDPDRFDFNVAAGEVKVFCSVNALRFYKIEFLSN